MALERDRRRDTHASTRRDTQRAEWTHCADREHQWEAREHARMQLGASRASALADRPDAEQRQHQEHGEQHQEQYE